MNIFTINIPSSNVGRILPYEIKINKNGSWTNVYYGKVYALPDVDKIYIDVEDIIFNYRFDGEGFISPVINANGTSYEITNNVEYKYWWNNMMVEIDINGLKYSATKYVSFYTGDNYGVMLELPHNSTIALNMNHQPIPHIPINPPAGFRFRQLVYNGVFTLGVDDNRSTVRVNGVGGIDLVGANNRYTINSSEVCRVDSCVKPYYLCWLTNSGTMQCQPFLKSSEFERSVEHHTRIDMSEYEWVFSNNERGKWKLKSQNLSTKDYKAYGEMFDSKYLVLLDMENMKMYYVNVTDTTYREKKTGVNNNKSIFFEVNVESCGLKRY